MPLERKSILLSFSGTKLKELRKVLFESGLSPQEFFSFIVDKLSTRETDIEGLVKQAADEKREKIKAGNVASKLLDEDSIYYAIEQENKQTKKEE